MFPSQGAYTAAWMSVVAVTLLVSSTVVSHAVEPPSHWISVEVSVNGTMSINGARQVNGHISQCTGRPAPEEVPYHIIVRYVSAMTGGECIIAVRDPRRRAYGSDHSHHAHHDHLVTSAFALRIPTDVTQIHTEDHSRNHEHIVVRQTLELTPSHHREMRTMGDVVYTIETSQLEVSVVQSVGSPSEQFNLIFVSSGYNGNDRKGYYERDVTNVVQFLSGASTATKTSAAPFDTYSSLFNIYRVWMSSNEEGASKPMSGLTVQNNLECAYGEQDDTILDCLHAKALLAASHAAPDPQRSAVIVMVYDEKFGGSGGGNIAVISASNAKSYELLMHNLGHAWAGVQDEFSYGLKETKQVPMKNCHWMSYNTPWQAFTDMRVVPEAKLGCTFSNYYKPTPGTCLMESYSNPGLCPVCQYYMLKAMYDQGMKLVSPTSPHLDETVYLLPNEAVTLHINTVIPTLIRPSDNANRFKVLWTVDGREIGWQQSSVVFSNPMPGNYQINVTVQDRTIVVLDSQRQILEQRGGNGPTALLQTYSFRVVVTAAKGSSGCTTTEVVKFNTPYCSVCDNGKTCTYTYPTSSLTALTVRYADLAGLQTWMVAIGIVFVVVGLLIFVVAWRVMTVHQENNPVEILPLTENIMIVRGILIAVQLLVLIIATFTIIYCVYQYGQLTVFGQSILLGVIACAVVVWFGSYIGVVAAYYKSRSLLFVNFILLLLLFGCVFLFSILLVYVLTNVENSGVVDQLLSEWETAVANRPADICDLESNLVCSGFNTSCAAFSVTAPGGSTTCPSSCKFNQYTNPCLSKIQSFVKGHFGAASAGGWVLTALLLAALVLSVLLGCAIKNRRNVVHRERRVRHATGQNILLPEEIEMLKKEFNKIDRDGSGDISREEFSLFYNAVMGTDLSPRELEEYFDKLDADGNGNLSFEEFLKVYVPHREPRRKSMVKPKSVVEISTSSSSSSSDGEDSVVQPTPKAAPLSAPPPPPGGDRKQAYAKETTHFDDDFAFEAPNRGASPQKGAPPSNTQRLGQNQNLNISDTSSRGNNQGAGRGATPNQVDLKGSYQSSQLSSARQGGGRAAAPPPRVDIGGRGGGAGGRGGAGGKKNLYSNTDDLDLDIDMDDDFM